MNINELHSLTLSDYTKFHDILNPDLWDEKHELRSEVKQTLLNIAQDFKTFLGIKDFDLKDITISGSNAGYNYNPTSDIDLHLVVDLPEADVSEVYRELFDAKKYQYNDSHDIKIRGSDVELYVQNANQPHVSQGIYSLLNNRWVIFPKRIKTDIDDISVISKYQDIKERIDSALSSDDLEKSRNLLKKIKNMRVDGLAKHGEFGVENLTFKLLRSQGLIGSLRDHANRLHDQELSLTERSRKSRRSRQRYVYGSFWSPGFSTSSDSSSGGNGGESIAESVNQAAQLKTFALEIIRELDIQHRPKIVLHTKPSWTQKTGSFGRYDPEQNVLHLATSDRHILDILRTMAHELVHCAQRHQGQLPPDAGETGSAYEDEANALAGRIMRGFAERRPELFNDIQLEESSGYIPTETEKNDPRFSNALTIDIRPGETGRQANKLGLQTNSQGRPALLRPGKKTRLTETRQKTDTQEDWHANDRPPGPETKPTMPRGTVRVDVSDMYDWYKLGKQISNLDQADAREFGKGPPSTIVSFGDEDLEHKYISSLKKLGLTTTDIDPVDPNQPKGMKRQKVDPTFNVNETQDENSQLLSINVAKQNINKILAAAQRIYDDWDESEVDTYAGGGICHLIADAICDVMWQIGIECTTVSCSYEQHVYVAVKVEEGVYTIDIPYSIYEEGGGFSWKKLPDIKFDPRNVVFYKVSGDPEEFDNYTALEENKIVKKKIIAGNKSQGNILTIQGVDDNLLSEKVQELIDQGKSSDKAIKQIAYEFELPEQKIYKAFYKQSLAEGKMAELDMDLEDPEITDRQFEKTYGMTRKEARELFSRTNMWDFPQVRDPDKPLHEQGATKDSVIFLNDNTVIVGQEHGKSLELSPETSKQVRAIAEKYGAWYEGNGMDRKFTKGIIDEYQGSWDDDLLSPSIKGYPYPFLYVLFSNIKANDTVKGKIGSDPKVSIFDRILNTQPSTNYFPDRKFDAETLTKFLQSVSEGPYDFVKMSQAPATEKNVRKFFSLGEKLMWPENWEEYPNKAGQLAKQVNDLRDKFLASRKSGVYVVGSGHLLAVRNLVGNQGVAESLRIDVPNEEWLQSKIDYAKKKGRDRFGAPYFNSTTAYNDKNVRVPIEILRRLPGMRGEQQNVRQQDLQAIKKILKDTGQLPLGRDGKEYVPFVMVAHNGEAWVNEGNHRIMAAAELYDEGDMRFASLPIELKYFDGGERVESGPLHPSKISQSMSENFVNKVIQESFDQPYPIIWSRGEYGDVDGFTILADGSRLELLFNLEDKESKQWMFQFYRDDRDDVSGQGDAQRVFATVLNALKIFLRRRRPNMLHFSASGETDSGQKSQSRSNLYTRLMQRYAPTWGYNVEIYDDGGRRVDYVLTPKVKQKTNENLADGRNPGRIGQQDVSEDLSWSSLDEGLSLENKMAIFEEYAIRGNLTGSIDQDKKDYFISLFKLVNTPVENKKYIVAPLALIGNKIMPLDSPAVMRFLGQDNNSLVFDTASGKKTYPSKIMRDLSVFNTFTFASYSAYDKFRTALSLKFDVSLPSIAQEQGVAEGSYSISDFKMNVYESMADFRKWMRSPKKNDRGMTRHIVDIYENVIVKDNTLIETSKAFIKRQQQAKEFNENFKQFDEREKVQIKLGNKIALLSSTVIPDDNSSRIELSGFITPKKIVKINLDSEGLIDSIKFDDGSIFPEASEFTTVGGIHITNTIFFPDGISAAKAYTSIWMLISNLEGQGWKVESYMNEDVAENFADGRKPGRKGLAKRMGVPTKASVSRLRQIAKSSSGEKARMAHWMANMKAGKAKKS